MLLSGGGGPADGSPAVTALGWLPNALNITAALMGVITHRNVPQVNMELALWNTDTHTHARTRTHAHLNTHIAHGNPKIPE